MPSSPPAFFALYEDPVEPGSGLWSDYHLPTSSPPPQMTEDKDALNRVGVDGDDDGCGNGNGKDGKTSKTNGITVDFSALIDEVGGGST